MLAWWPLYSIVDEGGPASFRDPSNLVEPMFWLLHGAMLVLFVLLVGQLAAAIVGPGSARRWQLGALLGLAALVGAAVLTAWIRSGEVWASPLPELVWGFDLVMLIETIAALLLAIALGTPGCEVGVWPELIGRLRGGGVSTRPICILGLHFVDEWEARRARARGGGKQAARAHRRR